MVLKDAPFARPTAASGRQEFLFDDQSWKIRWMVVDTGDWLPGRKVLVHPSAIAPLAVPTKPRLPMLSAGETLEVSVNLTRQQIEASPEAREDDPVTRDMETLLYDHYGWDPGWSGANFSENGVVGSGRGSGEGHRDWSRQRPGPGARLHSKSIMSTPPTANWAMSRISSPTTSAGTFDISSSRPGTGGRARPSGWRPTR